MLIERECQELERVKLRRVIDGDTIEVQYYFIPLRVRLIGINCPEVGFYGKVKQRMGGAAKQFLKNILMEDESPEVYIGFDVRKMDTYGRALCYVYTKQNTFINALLVRHGFARVDCRPPNDKYSDLLKSMEEQAKEKQLGIWYTPKEE